MSLVFKSLLDDLSAESVQMPSVASARFARFYADGTVLTLTDNPRISDYLFKTESRLAVDLALPEPGAIHYHLVADAGSHAPIAKYYRNELGLKSVVDIVRQSSEFVDVLALYSTESEGPFVASLMNAKFKIDTFFSKFVRRVSAEQGLVEKIAVASHMLPRFTQRSLDNTDPVRHQVCYYDDELLGNLLANVFSRVEVNSLTIREIQCIKLMLLGLSTKEIGLQLGISPRTAENHFNAIKEKLKLSTKWQLRDFFLKFSPKSVLQLTE